MKKRRTIKPFKPEHAISFDPLEFHFTLLFAMEASRAPSPGFRPSDLKIVLKEADGSNRIFRFGDNSMNRFGVAVKQKYSRNTKKFSSFMWRFFGLMDLIHGGILERRFYRESKNVGEPSEIHEVVLQIAATLPLNPKGQFERNAFLKALAKADAEYVEKNPQENRD